MRKQSSPFFFIMLVCVEVVFQESQTRQHCKREWVCMQPITLLFILFDNTGQHEGDDIISSPLSGPSFNNSDDDFDFYN